MSVRVGWKQRALVFSVKLSNANPVSTWIGERLTLPSTADISCLFVWFFFVVFFFFCFFFFFFFVFFFLLLFFFCCCCFFFFFCFFCFLFFFLFCFFLCLLNFFIVILSLIAIILFACAMQTPSPKPWLRFVFSCAFPYILFFHFTIKSDACTDWYVQPRSLIIVYFVR